jgi:RNA polymerase sigma-70 factor (ECF subfamily)
VRSPSDNQHGDPIPDGDTEGKSRGALVEDLFREHNESLIRFLTARMRSRQEAKEIAQEAYVRVLNLDQPGAVSFLRAFLFKTAANLAVDRMRSLGRRERLQNTALFDEFRETPTPERTVVGKQGVEVVERLLSELPPKCRQAFLLNRVQGLLPADIARQMGVSERTIRHYILRAFLYCRAGLDAAESDEGRSHG